MAPSGMTRFTLQTLLTSTNQLSGTDRRIGAGTIYWLEEKKLVKNKQDDQIKSITLWCLCNMQFSKKVYTVYNRVWGKAPRSWQVREFSVKCVTLNCKLQKKVWEQDVLLAPPIILLWHAPHPRSHAYGQALLWTYGQALLHICTADTCLHSLGHSSFLHEMT